MSSVMLGIDQLPVDEDAMLTAGRRVEMEMEMERMGCSLVNAFDSLIEFATAFLPD